MSPARELAAFALVLSALVMGFLGESLFGGKVLSPADVLFVSASFRDVKGPDYEPANRLLTDPVLQFQPWLEFNRSMLRRGRLPLWNDLAGCGAPHLANAQSAVFDPFHLIAYLGTLPTALGWIAAARLWWAGLGMFVLARSWDFKTWGRWFAGLTFPFCGFLVVWLLYPVTAAAVWMPWLFWASDGALRRRDPRSVGVLGLTVGCVFLAGHVQTSAYVLLSAGLYVAWTAGAGRAGIGPISAWVAGVGLGLTVAAVTIVPLWVYLGKSPVWGDRERERPSPWRVTRPRVLDTVCTAVPYAFGGQRRGQPNLARALGVHNLNESAGGFAGLATLIWLAPAAWRARGVQDRVGFLSALTAFGFLGAFEFPPVVNVLRACPVLNVMDHRRLTLWVAFGLVLLGGVGLDHLASDRPGRRFGFWVWSAAALVLFAASFGVARLEPRLRARAEAHYAHASEVHEGADPAVYQRRADRQVRQTLNHVPTQLRRTAAELAALAALAALAGRGVVSPTSQRLALLAITVVELFSFGLGLNPAIDAADDRVVPAVIAHLRETVETSGRVIGVGEELPPNVAMRYGLADARNYDSVELTRNLDWFEPLYEPDPRSRSSRRTVTWAGVVRARERLREAGVVAVVGATPPPAVLSARAERTGSVWVAHLDAEPIMSASGETGPTEATVDNGRIELSIDCKNEIIIILRHAFDPGWRADVDGQAVAVVPHRGAFLSVRVGKGFHRVRLAYDPPEMRAACAASLAGLVVAVGAISCRWAWTVPAGRVKIGG